jgi:hypothetical protein
MKTALFVLCFTVGFMAGFDAWFRPRPIQAGEFIPVTRRWMNG